MPRVDTMLLAIADQTIDRLVGMATEAIDQLYAVCDELARRDLLDEEKDILRAAHQLIARLEEGVSDHWQGGDC